MICPICHAQNPDGGRFCVRCEYPLTGAASATPTNQPFASTAPPDPSNAAGAQYGAPPSQPLPPYATGSQPAAPYATPPSGPAAWPPNGPYAAPLSQPIPGPYSTPLSQPYGGYPAPQGPGAGASLFGADTPPAMARPATRTQAFLLRNLSARVAVSAWMMAALGALVAVGIGLALTALVQALLSKAISDALASAANSSTLGSYLSGGVAGVLTPDVLKLFALEHRIPLDVSAQVTSDSVQAGGGMTLTLPITALLLIPALALLVGGYISAASDYSRNPRYSIARGALVGPFYAMLVAVLALFGSSTVSGGLLGVDGSVTVAPSVVLAFLYALVWGCLFGALGGWLQLFGRQSLSAALPALQRLQRGNLTGAVAGAVVAMVTGLAIFIALELGAVLLYNTTSAATITSGTAPSAVPLGSSLAVGLIGAFAPTFALYLFAFAAGASLDTYATASVGVANQSSSLSLLGTHPAWPSAVNLIVLVPLLAYFVGGWVAARVATARETSAGLAAGALMALPLSVLAALGAYISGASIDINLLGATVSEGVGPSVGSAFLAVLIGGAVVGALGGAAAVALPSLGRLPRALLLPIRPFGLALFPLFDRISGKPRDVPRSAARLWLYDAMLAALLLGILMLALDIAGVALAAVLSWNTVVTLFAVLSGLLVAAPLVLIAGALVAGLLGPSAPVSLAVAPGYSISAAGGSLPPPFLGAPGAAGFNSTDPPYSGPYSVPYSGPYSVPYSGPYSAPQSTPGGAAPTVPPEGPWSDATIPDDLERTNLGRGEAPPSGS